MGRSQLRTEAQGEAAQESIGRHRPLAGPLDFQDLDGALAQATRIPSVNPMTIPGVPVASARRARKTLMRSPCRAVCISNHAPGAGDNPLIWLWTSCAGRVKSMRASPLSILLA